MCPFTLKTAPRTPDGVVDTVAGREIGRNWQKYQSRSRKRIAERRSRTAGGSRERTLYLLTIALGAGWLKNAQRKTGAMPGKIKQLRCRMKSMATPAMVCGSLLLVVLVVAGHSVAKDKKTRKSACSNAHPEQVCTAASTADRTARRAFWR